MNRFTSQLALMIFISFILAGCSVNQRYIAPDLETPTEWNCDHAQELQNDSIDNYCWWESFNDPILNFLVLQAACQNLDLHIAMTRIMEARLSLKGVEANNLPHVDGSLGYWYASFNQKTLNKALGIEHCRRKSGQRSVNLFEAGFDAEWELDLFGMNAHQMYASQARLEATEDDFANVWVTLSAEIVRTYIELRGTQQRAIIVDKNIASQKEIVELNKSLIAGGFIGTIDQMQAEEELSKLIAQKPQLEFLIHKNIHHLSILLGYLPGDLYCELSPVQPLPGIPCDRPVGIPSELMQRRPDIKKAERDLAAASEEVAVAVAALFPRISLTGFIGEVTTFCTKGSFAGFVGPQLLMPIFNSKMLKQDVCLNKIKVEQALYQYQKTVLEAFEETENAIAAFHYNLERNHQLQRSLDFSKNAYTLSLQLYQNGLQDYLHVQTAHLSFLEVESALLQSEVDLLVSYISLYKALGGGWEIFMLDDCNP
jgi:outer membrane protein, multidrug efflux system